jgi:hypothetical protein
MEFETYLGVAVILLGLVMAFRKVTSRQPSEALESLVLSLLGALLVTASEMPHGWAGRTILLGIVGVAVCVRLAASRMSTHRTD